MKRWSNVISSVAVLAMVSVLSLSAETPNPEQKRNFFVGGFGSPSVKTGYFGFPIDATGDTGIGYGGIWAEYALFPKNTIFVSFETLIGAGGTGTQDTDGSEHSQGFIVAEPGINRNFRLTDFLCISPGIKYLWTTAENLSALTEDGINGPQASLTLRRGKVD